MGIAPTWAKHPNEPQQGTALMLLTRCTALAAIALTLSGCIIVDVSDSGNGHDEDSAHSVNADLHLSAKREHGDAASVNGDIHLAAGARAGEVETVNGDIYLGPNAHVEEVESVNGNIDAEAGAHIRDDVESVNGRVTLTQTSVAGDVELANGSLELSDSTVHGDIELRNTPLTLRGTTLVHGDVILRSKDASSPPILVSIGPQVRIAGALVLDRPVVLELDPRADISQIRGRFAP